MLIRFLLIAPLLCVSSSGAMEEEEQQIEPLWMDSGEFKNLQSLGFLEPTSKVSAEISQTIDARHGEFLQYVDIRVSQIERELREYTKGPADSRSWRTCSWVVTKSYFRLGTPTSENKAKDLIDLIMQAKAAERSNDEEIVIMSWVNQGTMIALKYKIATLITNYTSFSTDTAVQTQLNYLREYKERVDRVDKAFEKLL